jgi:hypothetical protein
MSQTYSISTRQREGEAERQRLAEEARQRRIEAERQRVAQINRQREAIMVQTQQLHQQIAELPQTDLSVTPMDIDLTTGLQESLQQQETSLTRLDTEMTAHQQRLQALESMTVDAYAVFDAMENALVETQAMSLEAMQQEEDGSWYARFNRSEEDEQAVRLQLKTDEQGNLLLDVTEGFQGDECDIFIEQADRKSVV